MQDTITVLYPAIPRNWWRPDLVSGNWNLIVVGVVVPAPPPHLPDDDPPELQQCPRCRAIITVEDSGVNFCDRCHQLVFVDDDLLILYPDLLPIRCPRCNATLENGYDPDCRAIEPPFFYECGYLVDGRDCRGDGFQFGAQKHLPSSIPGK